MNILIIIFTAIGLSIDSFAVSISYGTVIRKDKLKSALKLASIFGVFHVVMILIGYFAGISIKDYISVFDHWIAFIILSAVGIKMIIDEIKSSKESESSVYSSKIKTILYLAFATSIDALAIGISFSFVDASVILFAIIVGITVFVFSISGVMFGTYISEKIRFSIFGGIILILIGIKILVEHFFIV